MSFNDCVDHVYICVFVVLECYEIHQGDPMCPTLVIGTTSVSRMNSYTYDYCVANQSRLFGSIQSELHRVIPYVYDKSKNTNRTNSALSANFWIQGR